MRRSHATVPRVLAVVALSALLLAASGAWPRKDLRADPGQIPAAEYAALVALYSATGGDTTWVEKWDLPTGTPCSLYGVSCTVVGDETHITGLRLPSNGLNGTIPGKLADLTLLEDLNLDQNLLTGGVPEWLGTLTHLTSLDLCTNPLGGVIPPALGNLGSLWLLSLDGAGLTGTIPDELGDLSLLEELDLSGNSLSGTIPSELGQLGALRTLYLFDNDLDGTIPTAMGNLSSLQSFRLYGNHLQGAIPSELGNLAGLVELRLDGNRLEGAIPAQLGNLTALTTLGLRANVLSGAIPGSLANLDKLTSLTLKYNMLWADASTPGAFLESLDPGWQNTQTVPPANLTVNPGTGGVQLSWQAIPYTGDGGHYEIGLADVKEGPYTVAPDKADKSVTTAWIPEPTPGATWFAALRTVTPAHGDQQSELTSPWSAEVTCQATTVEVPPTRVTIAGPWPDPDKGNLYVEHTFTATALPANATAPLTYTWSPTPAAGQGSASASFRWEVAGTQLVSVTVSGSGATVTASRAFLVQEIAGAVVTQAAGGTLRVQNADGRSSVIAVPAGAVTESLTLVYRALPTAPADAPSELAFAGRHFALEAYRSDGTPVERLPFTHPVTVTMQYTDAEIGAAVEGTLRLHVREGSGWVDAAATCAPTSAYLREPDANRLTVAICHLSEFALFGDTPPQTAWTLLVPVVRRQVP